MKLKYSILLIFIISILGWNFYNCCEESTVEINERNFLVNNERYFIKDRDGTILKKSENLNQLINKMSWNKLRIIK